MAQQGLTQHVLPCPVRGRFMAANLGVGWANTASVDVLHRALPAPVSADVAQFYHMRANSQRLQQHLAAYDRQRHLTPKEAGYLVPFISPVQQVQFRTQAREREKQHLLAMVIEAG